MSSLKQACIKKAELFFNNLSGDITKSLEPSVEEFYNTAKINERICEDNLNTGFFELHEIERNLQTLDDITSKILTQQNQISDHLQKLEKDFPRPDDFFSSDSFGLRNPREDLKLNQKLASRYLADTIKILSKPNPSTQFSISEYEEDLLNELERKIVIPT